MSEHDHSHDDEFDPTSPMEDGHFLRKRPEAGGLVEMQCQFCHQWMPCEFREYDTPSVTLNPHNSKLLVYTADLQLRAVHECMVAESILGEVMHEHMVEHHQDLLGEPRGQ